MKLHQHFIVNFLFIFAGTFFLALFVSYFAAKEINLNQYKNFMKSQIELIKIQLHHTEDLDKLVLLIKEKTGKRITIIDDDGRVIAESDFDKNSMDNQAERKEIRIARAQVDGYALRYSETLGIELLYVASQSYFNEKPVFVRLATKLKFVHEEFYNMWLKLSLIFAFSISLGIYIIYKLSQNIKKEIRKVTSTLDDISNKNYKTAVNASFAEEFIEIEKHIEGLSKRLEKREKQKRKYTAKIKLISKQRSDIISAISHEFKNPIASVMGYAQTLLDDPNANEKIRERFLEKIVQNSHKISEMIDRLSLATKFENGDLSPKVTSFDLYSLAKDITDSFQDKIKDRTFTCSGKSLMVKADKTMIELVITNLIDNAVKYSQADISVYIKNGFLHVKDSGIGIEENEIEKVTNKFYRSDTFSWDNSIGLGLALVKHILNLHESDLHIKSKLGVGSDFSFKL